MSTFACKTAFQAVSEVSNCTLGAAPTGDWIWATAMALTDKVHSWLMQAAPPQLAWKLLGVNMLETLSDRMLNLFVLSKVWKKLTSAGGHLGLKDASLCP